MVGFCCCCRGERGVGSDGGPPPRRVTVEAWVKVLNKEEARVIYSHGLKNSGGEVFIGRGAPPHLWTGGRGAATVGLKFQKKKGWQK